MEETSIVQERSIFDWKKYPSCHDVPMLEQSSPIHPTNVAERLKLIRAAFGLRKSEFADLVGVDRSSYTKIENGAKPFKPEWAFEAWSKWGVPMEYTYRGSLDNIPDKLEIAIRKNLKPLD